MASSISKTLTFLWLLSYQRIVSMTIVTDIGYALRAGQAKKNTVTDFENKLLAYEGVTGAIQNTIFKISSYTLNRLRTVTRYSFWFDQVFSDYRSGVVSVTYRYTYWSYQHFWRNRYRLRPCSGRSGVIFVVSEGV